MVVSLWHEHHRDYRDDLPFWLDITAPGESVLELGCGAGRVILPLARAGRVVWGIDQAWDILRMTRSALDQAQTSTADRVRLAVMDMTQLGFRKTFDVVLSPCNTFSLFDEPSRSAILDQVIRHLTREGKFAVSMPNPSRLEEIMGQGHGEGEPVQEDSFRHPRTGNPVQVSSRVEPGSNGVMWTWYYDHLLPDGRVEREKVSRFHFLTPTPRYVSELEARGFQVKRFGHFQKTPYRRDSPYLILVAEKG